MKHFYSFWNWQRSHGRAPKILAVLIVALLAIVTLPGAGNVSLGVNQARVGGGSPIKEVLPARVGGIAPIAGETSVYVSTTNPNLDSAGQKNFDGTSAGLGAKGILTGLSAGTVTITCDANGNVPEDKVKQYIGNGISITLDNGQSYIVNNTNCNLPVSLATYKMFDTQLGNQEVFFTSPVFRIGPGKSQTIFASVPECMAQLDLYYGSAPLQLDNANSYQNKTLAWDFHMYDGLHLSQATGPFCVKQPSGQVVIATDGTSSQRPAGQVSVTKTAPSSVNRGEELRFNIQVRNVGQTKIAFFSLLDNVDNQLTFLRSNPSGCSLTASSFSRGTVKCDHTSNLNIGQTVSYQLTFKVDTNAVCDSVITNRALVVPDDSPESLSNITHTKVNCPSANTLACAPSSQTVAVNQNVNLSASGGTGSYSWSASGGSPASGNGNGFTTKYASSGVKSIALTSGGASVNCQVSVSATVDSNPALIVEKSGAGLVNLSDTYAYNVVIKNTGNAAAREVILMDAVPSGTTFVSASGGNCQLQDLSVRCVVSDIAAGSSRSVQLTFRVNSNAICDSIIFNQARVSAVNLSQVFSNQTSTRVICAAINNPNASIIVDKLVRNATRGGNFANTLSGVLPGDVLEYQIQIKNTGNSTLSNIQLSDVLSGTSYLSDMRNISVSLGSIFGSLSSGGTASLNTNLAPGAIVSVNYFYSATPPNNTSNWTTCNTATVKTGSLSGQDTVCVNGSNVAGGNVNLQLSKRSFNDTQGRDAVSVIAKRGDLITYVLKVANTGNSDATGYVVTEDLSGVLPLADVVNLNGGQLSGQVLSYPDSTVPANGFIEKQFQVRVKTTLSPNVSYVLRNVFGNSVDITINTPATQTTPRTGGSTAALGAGGLGILFASILFSLRRRKVFA